ncbi:DUF3006 domain-containing protein [Pseudalkalibacillus sp. SCS-8]|uniref:DUF3006 domain-containing protein n=1 Tax=Pseudalkalibacillus nanhaiensis TaxID=3115291 RepID=UPI0032DA2BFC
MSYPSKYTVDRFEGDLAVLLDRSDETKQKDVPLHYLPKDVKVGDIVEEKLLINGKPSYQILKEETDEAMEKAENLLNKLKKKF